MASGYVGGRIIVGEQVFEDLEVWLREDVRAGSVRSWHGTFSLPELTNFRKNCPYRLELKDGRSGNVTITGTSVGSRSAMIVSFESDGALA